jgi:hypothetical protein
MAASIFSTTTDNYGSFTVLEQALKIAADAAHSSKTENSLPSLLIITPMR